MEFWLISNILVPHLLAVQLDFYYFGDMNPNQKVEETCQVPFETMELDKI